MTTPVPPNAAKTEGCRECKDLECGREHAAAERDLSRVTDFNVLICRHQRAHANGS